MALARVQDNLVEVSTCVNLPETMSILMKAIPTIYPVQILQGSFKEGNSRSFFLDPSPFLKGTKSQLSETLTTYVQISVLRARQILHTLETYELSMSYILKHRHRKQVRSHIGGVRQVVHKRQLCHPCAKTLILGSSYQIVQAPASFDRATQDSMWVSAKKWPQSVTLG